MLGVKALLPALGHPIEDPEEESFVLFCHTTTTHDLGCVDNNVNLLEVTVGNHDYVIQQSPKILSSNRRGGTTGAVVWKITPLFAKWIATSKLLSKFGILNSNSNVLELGCGISGIIALTLRSIVKQYHLTDQDYVMKFLKQNIDDNTNKEALDFPSSKKRRGKSVIGNKRRTAAEGALNDTKNIIAYPLDWETDEIISKLSAVSHSGGFDIVIVCDCIYNDTLIHPLVQTCADICKLRQGSTPTLCINAQQLRSPEVFESWLKAFNQKFYVWRIPEDDLTHELRIDSGYAVHIGILR
ncbi:Diaminohydroxyphosphoribosylamino-pyrimidine deaminase [Golovinomyces cichoracearum]|uniref:Diaminohydroxyphosphoribosylamino-pyrimidine deaminase n=1 Tax=Golovinomyces cichoracearum TaxID=62708 RepID=A0A420HYT2_9PEZI|nr:Diaminohydroxyphosphoribosylamino-pyrimidine deaminase [Golovinomyces cichoracearum]